MLFPGPYDVRCDPSHGDLGSWPDDLKASPIGDYIPACDASRPDDLGSMSLVVALRTFRHDIYVGLVLVTLTMSEGGIVLVKLWLIFS